MFQSDLSYMDEWLNAKFLFLMILAFCYMTFANGESTIVYIDSHINPSIDLPSYNYTVFNQNFSIDAMHLKYFPDNQLVLHYRDDIIKKQKYIPYLSMFIYFIILPGIDIFYLIYWWKNGK